MYSFFSFTPEKLKIPFNNLIIRPVKLFKDSVIMKNAANKDVEFVIAGISFNPKDYVSQCAEVIAVPDKIKYGPGEMGPKIDILVQPGDVVYFHWHDMLMVFGTEADKFQESPINQNTILIDGALCAFMDYRNILGYERDGIFSLLNENIIIEMRKLDKPIRDYKMNSQTGEITKKIVEVDEGHATILMVPPDELELTPGTRIIFRPKTDLPVVLPDHLGFKEPRVVGRSWIWAILES